MIASRSKSYFGLGMFAPPFGPADFVRSPSGVQDDPLIGWTEWLGKTGQRGLDQPRFKRHPCGLAVGIELSGHPQRFERGCNAPGIHDRPDNNVGLGLACARTLSGCQSARKFGSDAILVKLHLFRAD